MTSKGLRVIGITTSDMTVSQFESLREQTEDFTNDRTSEELLKNQTFLALVALKDPYRPKLKDSLAYAPLSGISVRVCSGDHLDTTKKVA